MTKANKITSYVTKLSPEQAEQLKQLLTERGWDMGKIAYSLWQARRDKTTVTAYESGKMTAQGRGVEDFIKFILEPEITKNVDFSTAQYEKKTATITADFIAHGGIDESGKGDFFGPLVICACYVDRDNGQALLEAGVQDSKAIKSDKKIIATAMKIKKLVKDRYSIVKIGNQAYNQMYQKIGNLNRLLAWGHARAIENLLDKVPQCQYLLADKFAHERILQQALMSKGRQVKLLQRTKAESDVAVAAASILARDIFVREMNRLGQELDLETLPKGASRKVDETAAKLVAEHGFDTLNNYAKLHFKTVEKVKKMLA